MKPVFALIDCDNFFVSCERLFRPDLEGRPVVVMSSNDGCAVSRSNEAKALGIPMGAPMFKYRPLFRQHEVITFSANFELYGDISERITRVLTSITPRTEVYSVDEAFLDLSALKIKNYTSWAAGVRQRLLHEVGIPASVGIAPTKTLAKLAREHAKKENSLGGILSLVDIPTDIFSSYLKTTPISDIWGVGRRLAPKLRGEGFYTAHDLANMRPKHAQQLMGVKGRQLVAELNQQACFALEPFGKPRQTVMNGRMFGQDTRRFEVIEAAIASLTARASLTIRKSGLLACSANIMLSTNKHKPGFRYQHASIDFNTPTSDTGIISAALVKAAKQLFAEGCDYHRANVLLYNLISEESFQADLFGNVNIPEADRSQARLEVMDSINAHYGKSSIKYAAEALSEAWLPKREHRSPRYTSSWEELPIIK